MGTLFVVSTPIGNLGDITVRAIQTLLGADVIACEDTRVTGNLLTLLKDRYPAFVTDWEKHPQLIRCDNETEMNRVPEFIEMLRGGKDIVFVSDAGTPLVSDPGYLLVRESIKRGIPVVPVPGVSSAITALSASGLPATAFMFLGYVPEKESAARKFFAALAAPHAMSPVTYITFAAPHKLSRALAMLAESLGPTLQVVVARELTKVHEEFFRGTVTEAATHFSDPKGEFVVLFTV